ncbi:peptidase M23B [Actibacterium mucosum KCTC 23349]|uniref:Peptidase M23B n=1 Tax=Actibacterium mucosum KCTC 23349 TaxID=1454373 RepID=A0A037ZRG7_9RHOB|nr:peptidoglycan DD-metalloendopeptidase family protein [Actibacterium mucosum]KAJ57422.1 peptidase M23B [Actibacterium mucosum KCTC 23349]
MTRIAALFAVALTCLPCVLAAQTDPVQTARRAAVMLDQAGLALQDASGARDRVAALTQTVRAYEEGLTALREGLRRVIIREQVLRAELDARREEISELLAVLATLQRDPETLLLLHPSGPLGTAQSGMLLREVTPALQSRVNDLRAQLDEVTLLRALQESAESQLADGLDGIQTARTALSQAVSDRTDLPQRLSADPARLDALLQSSETLEGFATGLLSLDDAAPLPPVSQFKAARGNLPLPAQGTVLRRFGEADAAGIKRQGLVLATAPLALVTTPSAATIRYRGPLLDYGNVMILEPAGDVLIVLGGLAQVYGETGQVLPAGAPVGLMGGQDPAASAFLRAGEKGSGNGRTETLYIELRQNGQPEDPAPWFAATKE